MHLIGIEPAYIIDRALILQGFLLFVLHFVLHIIKMI